MDFEVRYALKLLGEGTDPYLVAEAFNDPDITMKRYAMEALEDLSSSDAVKLAIAKIRLY